MPIHSNDFLQVQHVPWSRLVLTWNFAFQKDGTRNGKISQEVMCQSLSLILQKSGLQQTVQPKYALELLRTCLHFLDPKLPRLPCSLCAMRQLFFCTYLLSCLCIFSGRGLFDGFLLMCASMNLSLGMRHLAVVWWDGVMRWRDEMKSDAVALPVCLLGSAVGLLL